MKPAPSDTRKPYGGSTRSLVIALDVGTTFSGVSYAILEPGEIPMFHGVTRFPGQEHVAGNSKIPSIMYYDKYGRMVAAGAEAESAAMISLAEDEGWTKAELFKLRLRPRTMKLNMNGMRLAPLPRHKTAVDVFGDFLGYLFNCTRSFITDTHANGPALWHAVQHSIEFVLSHPNGWEGAQQTKMRRAAVYGCLIPDTDEGKARIRFVTEGEASLHACVQSGLAADVLSNPSGHGFLVADAGGGTLDISSYAVRGTAPLVIEEIAPPDCVFAGSVFVSRRARLFLAEKLKNSKYGTPESLDHITKRFDETTKRLFRDKKDSQFISFGSPLDKDLTVPIRGGQLKLTGVEVAELFEPSVAAAVASIQTQVEASNGIIKSVWLVGGFAASPWLFSQLQERLASINVTVSRPDTQTSKAVADGALGFYCDHHVSARMSKYMYGVEFLREFDQTDEEHIARKSRLCELPSGPSLLPDAFDCILARSVKVKESTVFSRKYCTELTNLSTLSVFEVEIWCYRGGNTIPKWIVRQAEDFSTLCVVRADLSPLSGSAEPKMGKNGKMYWTIVFSVEIHFGLTEFKARIKWVDSGRTKYGPASIVYSESGHRAAEDESDTCPEDDLDIPSPSPSGSYARAKNLSPASNKATTDVGLGGVNTSSISGRNGHHIDSKASSAKSSPHVSHTLIDTQIEQRGREIAKDKGRGKSRFKELEEPGRSSANSATPTGLSDFSLGRSPGKLANALAAVWGSGSKQPSSSPRADISKSAIITPKDELLSPIAHASSAPEVEESAASPFEIKTPTTEIETQSSSILASRNIDAASVDATDLPEAQSTAEESKPAQQEPAAAILLFDPAMTFADPPPSSIPLSFDAQAEILPADELSTAKDGLVQVHGVVIKGSPEMCKEVLAEARLNAPSDLENPPECAPSSSAPETIVDIVSANPTPAQETQDESSKSAGEIMEFSSGADKALPNNVETILVEQIGEGQSQEGETSKSPDPVPAPSTVLDPGQEVTQSTDRATNEPTKTDGSDSVGDASKPDPDSVIESQKTGKSLPAPLGDASEPGSSVDLLSPPLEPSSNGSGISGVVSGSSLLNDVFSFAKNGLSSKASSPVTNFSSPKVDLSTLKLDTLVQSASGEIATVAEKNLDTDETKANIEASKPDTQTPKAGGPTPKAGPQPPKGGGQGSRPGGQGPVSKSSRKKAKQKAKKQKDAGVADDDEKEEEQNAPDSATTPTAENTWGSGAGEWGNDKAWDMATDS